MTGDAQAEAEQIVGEYGQLAYEWGCAYTDSYARLRDALSALRARAGEETR